MLTLQAHWFTGPSCAIIMGFFRAPNLRYYINVRYLLTYWLLGATLGPRKQGWPHIIWQSMVIRNIKIGRLSSDEALSVTADGSEWMNWIARYAGHGMDNVQGLWQITCVCFTYRHIYTADLIAQLTRSSCGSWSRVSSSEPGFLILLLPSLPCHSGQVFYRLALRPPAGSRRILLPCHTVFDPVIIIFSFNLSKPSQPNLNLNCFYASDKIHFACTHIWASVTKERTKLFVQFWLFVIWNFKLALLKRS